MQVAPVDGCDRVKIIDSAPTKPRTVVPQQSLPIPSAQRRSMATVCLDNTSIAIVRPAAHGRPDGTSLSATPSPVARYR